VVGGFDGDDAVEGEGPDVDGEAFLRPDAGEDVLAGADLVVGGDEDGEFLGGGP
jgi:hypothetical protein